MRAIALALRCNVYRAHGALLQGAWGGHRPPHPA